MDAVRGLVCCHSWRSRELRLSCDLQGIELYGVGKWREISNHLPDWNDNELRSRTAKLLGSQSLAAYIGWRGRKYAVPLPVHAHPNRAQIELWGSWVASGIQK